MHVPLNYRQNGGSLGHSPLQWCLWEYGSHRKSQASSNAWGGLEGLNLPAHQQQLVTFSYNNLIWWLHLTLYSYKVGFKYISCVRTVFSGWTQLMTYLPTFARSGILSYFAISSPLVFLNYARGNHCSRAGHMESGSK